MYPSFPSKIQAFKDPHHQQPRELRPLLPLYHGGDRRRGLFALPFDLDLVSDFESVDRLPPTKLLERQAFTPKSLERQAITPQSFPNPELDQIALSSVTDSDAEGLGLMTSTRKQSSREVIIAIEREGHNDMEKHILPEAESHSLPNLHSSQHSHSHTHSHIQQNLNDTKIKFPANDSFVDTIKLTMDDRRLPKRVLQTHKNKTEVTAEEKTRSWKVVRNIPEATNYNSESGAKSDSSIEALYKSGDTIVGNVKSEDAIVGNGKSDNAIPGTTFIAKNKVDKDSTANGKNDNSIVKLKTGGAVVPTIKTDNATSSKSKSDTTITPKIKSDTTIAPKIKSDIAIATKIKSDTDTSTASGKSDTPVSPNGKTDTVTLDAPILGMGKSDNLGHAPGSKEKSQNASADSESDTTITSKDKTDTRIPPKSESDPRMTSNGKTDVTSTSNGKTDITSTSSGKSGNAFPSSSKNDKTVNLWTLCDPVSETSSISSDTEDDLESDCSFQSVVDNNSLDNNGLRGGRKGGRHNRNKDMDDELLFQSCLESGEEDHYEELEQIRRLLRVDPNLHLHPHNKLRNTEENTTVKEPELLCKNLLCKNSLCENWELLQGDQSLPLKRIELKRQGLSDHEGEGGKGEKEKNQQGPIGKNDDRRNQYEATGEYFHGQNKVLEEEQVKGAVDLEEAKGATDLPGVMNQEFQLGQGGQAHKNQEFHLGHPQSRKYKSRVLIGLNDSKTVEVKGESEVEIIIGQGTYLKDDLEEEESEIDEADVGRNVNNGEPLSSAYPCRESPEGEESGSEESRVGQDEVKCGGAGLSSEKCVEAPSRSEPDGADADKSSDDETETDSGGATTPILEMNSEDEGKSESTDSWTEEVTFVEMDSDLPAPLDMTLHTICEESETESEYRKVTPVNSTGSDQMSANHAQGLEKYFNFATDDENNKTQNLHFDYQNYEESEFSDTFSESSFSSGLRQSSIPDLRSGQGQLDMEDGEAVDLASGRLEKYFMNLGVGLNHDSDSVGSESETGTSVLENKKKVLKHHRRSAEYEDEHFQISEDEDCAFEQEGFDTIKKQRKLRKSQEDLLSSSHLTSQAQGHGQGQGHAHGQGQRKSTSETIPEEGQTADPKVPTAAPRGRIDSSGVAGASALACPSPKPSHEPISVEPPSPSKLKRVNVSRSNSFTWSSDEEVNLMMRSLRQLVKNMTLSKKSDEGKGDLMYLENELIRLMKTESVKTMVDTMSMSSDSEGQEDVMKIFGEKGVGGDSEPELLSKVMSHIGERLSTWMKDEDEKEKDEGATIQTAQSVSSDLNDDLESDTRFSWKGSFESTLAKRQSVGSSDSLDYCAPPGEGQETFSDRSILRSSSLHHLAHSQPILEESESLTSSLSRLNPVTSSESGSDSSGGKGSNHGGQVITKSKSLFLDPAPREVKSARYRPPGYFESHTLSSDVHSSTPVLSQRRERIKSTEAKDAGNRFKVRGLMEFSMQYNYKLVTFEVMIKQCRDLAAVDAKKGRSDPYVKGYLLPDRSKSNKRKTKTKKNTLNPVFGETLKFPISLEELESRTLWLSVWHSDMFGKNEFMGQVTLPLRGMTFDDPNFTWYPLRDEKHSQTNESSPPESPPLDLIVALKWTPRNFSRERGNLSVLFKEAKGLKLIKNSVPSTFIKCCPINDRSKKQKTSLAKRTTNPVWNATMTFENVGRDGLDVTLYSSDRLNHEPVAHLKVDSDLDLWRNMERREGFWVEGIVQLTPTY